VTTITPHPPGTSLARSVASDASGDAGRRRPMLRRHAQPVPPLTPRLQLVRAATVVVLVLMAGLVMQLAVVSDLQHRASQERAFAEFRTQLAEGTAPTGPVDFENHVVPNGEPIALLEIPTIGLEDVVVQGTSPSDLFIGPGHRRDTPLPGQFGTSILMGRRAAYGSPFGSIGDLVEGDLIIVTTGQGAFEYRVIGVRKEGDPVPPPAAADSARLVLATADGRAFLPSGVLRVDAKIDTPPVGGQPRLVTDDTLPGAERFMGTDDRTLWVLVLWLQGLLGLALAVVWAWHRWGRPQTWIALAPPLAVVGLGAAGEVARLLPNLL
jgi:sortase A